MELKKIEKQEVYFIRDSFPMYWMRISAGRWYVKSRVTGNYYLESPRFTEKLEDAFQKEYPTSGLWPNDMDGTGSTWVSSGTWKPQENEWYAVPPYGNEGWHVLNERGELVATFETKEECIKAVNAVNGK